MKHIGKKCMFIILAALLLITGSFHQAYAQERLVFSRAEGLTNDICEQVLKEAYQRIGIQIETKTFPSERAIITSNKGEVDGENTRVAGIEKNYPNLMMVPVAVSSIETVVFVKNVTFKVTGWESLKPYIIGTRLGAKYVEQEMKGMNVDPVATYEQCFKKLDSGRNDVVVVNRLDGLQTVRKLKLEGIRILEPPLSIVKIYHYLHKKNADFMPKITKALQDMESEGKIRAIQEQAVAELLSQ